MFTGLIEAIGTVTRVEPLRTGEKGCALTVSTPFKGLALGESVAVNGVCLTAAKIKKLKSGGEFTAALSEETLRRTTLQALQVGTRVNLERALKLGDRMGGHIVQGHVDAVGKILELRAEGQSTLFIFSLPVEIEPFVVTKGSIAVDGVSLTAAGVEKSKFSVAVIPHTQAHTTLGDKKAGDTVNLEADILAKVTAKQVELYAKTLNPARPPDELFLKRAVTWEELAEGDL